MKILKNSSIPSYGRDRVQEHKNKGGKRRLSVCQRVIYFCSSHMGPTMQKSLSNFIKQKRIFFFGMEKHFMKQSAIPTELYIQERMAYSLFTLHKMLKNKAKCQYKSFFQITNYYTAIANIHGV